MDLSSLKSLGQDYIDLTITEDAYQNKIDAIKTSLNTTLTKLEQKFEAKIDKPPRVVIDTSNQEDTKCYDSMFLVNYRYNRIIGYVGNVRLTSKGMISADSVVAVKTMPAYDVQDVVTTDTTESDLKMFLLRFKACKDTVTNINRGSSDLILVFRDSEKVEL